MKKYNFGHNFPALVLVAFTLKKNCYYQGQLTCVSLILNQYILFVLYTVTNQIWGKVLKFKFLIQSNSF